MDKTDERILDLLKGNARMSYQELGDSIGMSRVAAKKRVRKLEREGIIRGYNTCIYRDDEVMMLIDIVTVPEMFETVLRYVVKQPGYIRQIFKTAEENHMHIVAVSDQVSNLKYLTRMIKKECGAYIAKIESYTVKGIIKDVYGGIRYEPKSESDSDGDHEAH